MATILKLFDWFRPFTNLAEIFLPRTCVQNFVNIAFGCYRGHIHAITNIYFLYPWVGCRSEKYDGSEDHTRKIYRLNCFSRSRLERNPERRTLTLLTNTRTKLAQKREQLNTVVGSVTERGNCVFVAHRGGSPAGKSTTSHVPTLFSLLASDCC